MSSPLLTVIMPVFRGEFLREAVQSIERTGLDFEIILTDDFLGTAMEERLKRVIHS